MDVLVLITESVKHDDIIMKNIDDPIITVVVSVVIALVISSLVEMSLMKLDKNPLHNQHHQNVCVYVCGWVGGWVVSVDDILKPDRRGGGIIESTTDLKLVLEW